MGDKRRFLGIFSVSFDFKPKFAKKRRIFKKIQKNYCILDEYLLQYSQWIMGAVLYVFFAYKPALIQVFLFEGVFMWNEKKADRAEEYL